MSLKAIIYLTIAFIGLMIAAVFADHYLPWLMGCIAAIVFFAKTLAQELIDQKNKEK